MAIFRYPPCIDLAINVVSSREVTASMLPEGAALPKEESSLSLAEPGGSSQGAHKGEWKMLPGYNMEGKLSACKRTWIPQVVERPTLPNSIPPNGKDVKGDGVWKTSASLMVKAFKDHQVIQKRGVNDRSHGSSGYRLAARSAG